ncbi:MAG TPA: type II toxin-antitoxin system HicB family antitoxin [Planctomycetota bacterium]|nr:type II toxin-antitoxin system HicB family antitoxin [Planctomycetota bacterium]
MGHRHEIIIHWSDDDEVFVAEAPELPGCAAHGDTPEAALLNCGEAIALWIDTARDSGRPIPTARQDPDSLS